MEGIAEAICVMVVGMFLAVGELMIAIVGGLAVLLGVGVADWQRQPRPLRWWAGRTIRAFGLPAALALLILGGIWIKNIVDPPTLTERVIDTAVAKAIDLAIDYCANRKRADAEQTGCVGGD